MATAVLEPFAQVEVATRVAEAQAAPASLHRFTSAGRAREYRARCGKRSRSDIDLWPVLTDADPEITRAVVSVTALAAAFFIAYSYVSTRIENYAWKHTLLGVDRFSMGLEFGRMPWIYGLMIPWAQVRLARYRLSRLCLQTVAGLDRHVAAGREDVSDLPTPGPRPNSPAVPRSPNPGRRRTGLGGSQEQRAGGRRAPCRSSTSSWSRPS